MQIRVYSGSNTSPQMQTSQYLYNGEVKRVENRLSSQEFNRDGSNSTNTCQKNSKECLSRCSNRWISVNTFEEDEKDLYSVMVVLDKCQTVVNCSTRELIQIEEKHEFESKKTSTPSKMILKASDHKSKNSVIIKPRRPFTPAWYFEKSYRKDVKDRYPHLSNKETKPILKGLWDMAPVGVKKRYEDERSALFIA